MKINEDLMKVLGVLFTDGGVSQTNKFQTILHASNNSREWLEEILQSAKNLWDFKWFKIQDFGTWFHLMVMCPEEMKNDLFEISKSFRKIPCNTAPIHNHTLVNCSPINVDNIMFPETKLPEFLFTVDKGLKSSFLKFTFGGDGTASISIRTQRNSVRIDKHISLACRNPILKRQFFQLISEFVECSENSQEIRVALSHRNIRDFVNQIGFPESVKISGSKIWDSFTRSDIAKLILFCEDVEDAHPKGFWNRFQSPQEARLFLLESLINSTHHSLSSEQFASNLIRSARMA